MKLVIISDLHFEEENGNKKINAITEQFLDRVSKKYKPNEVIIFVVLGDIINRGGLGDNVKKFAVARLFFDKIRNRFRKSYFYFIPGNHELGVTVDGMSSIVEEFHEFAQRYNSSYERYTPEQSVFSEEVEGVNLIMMDSNLSRSHSQNGVIDVNLLKQYMSAKCLNLIFMHHPPCELEGADRDIRNSEELIGTHPNLVFYGHQHGSVKIPDLLKEDTSIHSVGAMFQTMGDAKSQFLLLDIKASKICSAWRYEYVAEYYKAKLLFPKKENIQSQNQKFAHPEKPEIYIERVYKEYPITRDSSELSWNEILQQKNCIIVDGEAGMGKTLSLSSMYFCMLNDEDYFPVWIRLRDMNTETIKKYIKYAQHHTIDCKTPLLIIDGMDEIRGDYLESFIKDIGSVIAGDSDVKVVISIRSNYQQSIEGFNQYKLVPINIEDMKEFVSKSGVVDVTYFVEEVIARGYTELIGNPFYANELIKIYLAKNTFPLKNELFKSMIKVRFMLGDKRHPSVYSKTLMANESELLCKLRELSFYMSATHKYSIANETYTEIINLDIREQFQKIGLLTNREADMEMLWEFEHRNFPEYLTAEYIKDMELEQLLEVVTYDVNHSKLRPSWVNVIGFLLPLRYKQDFREWLLECAVEELCELQPDSLSIEERNKVFIALLQNMEDKNRLIYSRYDGEIIMKYFWSREILNYICLKLENYSHEYEVLNYLYLLEYCTEFYGMDNDLTAQLTSICIATNQKKYVMKRAMVVLAKIINREDMMIIMELVQKDTNIDIIAGICGLITATKTADIYVEYIYQILEQLSEILEDYSAKKRLIEVFRSLEDTNHILKVIEIISKNEDNHRLYYGESIIHILTEKLKNRPEMKEPQIMKQFVRSLIYFSKSHMEEGVEALRTCIKQCGASEQALEILLALDLKEVHMLYALEGLMDEDLVEKLAECYKNGIVSTDIIRMFRRRLSTESKLYNRMKAVFDKSDESIICQEPVLDWKKNRKENNQKVFNCFFDKTEFMNLVEQMLVYYGDDVTCGKLMGKKYHSIPLKRSDLHSVATVLYHSAKKETKVLDFLARVNWSIFSMYQVMDLLMDNEEIKVSKNQEKMLEFHYMKLLSENEFEKYPTSHRTVNAVRQITFLSERLGFVIDDNTLLEFLSLPWYAIQSMTGIGETIVLQYVEEKIQNRDGLRKRILENIEKENLNPYAKETCIHYCDKYELTDALDLAIRFLQEPAKADIDIQYSAIQYLINIKDEYYVDSLVNEHMDEKLLKYLSIKLTCHNQKLEALMIRKNTEDKDHMLYLGELLAMNSRYGLETYIDFVKVHKKIPEKCSQLKLDGYVTEQIRSIKSIELLDYIIELYGISMSSEFTDNELFGLKDSVSKAIQNLILDDKALVRKKLLELSESNPENDDLKASCYWYIGKIDADMSQSMDEPWDERKVLAMIIHSKNSIQVETRMLK